MSYYFSKTVKGLFEEVLEKVTDSLKNEGFGILTEIDVKETLKKKLVLNLENIKYWGHATRLLLIKLFKLKTR